MSSPGGNSWPSITTPETCTENPTGTRPAIAVDTHVKRVSGRLGLTAETDPVKVELDLKALYPEKKWSGLSMRFIQFGRDTCDARRPRCGECEMFKLCEWPDRFEAAGKPPT